MDISSLFAAIALSSSIQMCEINGVPTYTDRSDVCDESQPVDLTGGTFSMVDAWIAPIRPAAIVSETPPPRQIIVERYIEQPIYLPQSQTYYLGNYRRHQRPRPKYPYLPDLRPSLYRDRMGYATMPHQQPKILGERYQGRHTPTLRPLPRDSHRQYNPSSSHYGRSGGYRN
jgi:hypothetical protein